MEESQKMTYTQQTQNELTDATKIHLKKICKWIDFFVVTGFANIIFLIAGVGLLFGVGLFFLLTFLLGGDTISVIIIFGAIALAIVCIIAIVIRIRLNTLLRKFSGNLEMITKYSNNNEIEPAFYNLRLFFSSCGMLVIIIAIVAAVMPIAIICAMFIFAS